jgi:hypothetical protein
LVVLAVTLVFVGSEVVVVVEVLVDSAVLSVEIDIVLSADVSHARLVRARATTRPHLDTAMNQT